VLTAGAWSELVSRLNESSRKKQLHLLKAQHRQIANQLSGLTFAPQISERSRELAAMNKSLPERVAALMIKKKGKLDRIRMEKAERELAEATFKPALNAPRRARGGDDGSAAADAERRVGHLLQYEIDRRVRAEQRKTLIEEMENKALTFNPTINKNSARIVSRMQREAAERAALAGLDGPADGGPGSPGGGAGGTATSVSASLSKAAAERKKVEAILLGRAPKGLGRSHLPGHEEETFTPAINARSRALASDRAVHDRLYGARKLPEPEAEERVRAAHARDEAGLPSAAVPGAALGPGGEPAPGHPQFFNAVPWAAAPHDFLLRRLLAVPAV